MRTTFTDRKDPTAIKLLGLATQIRNLQSQIGSDYRLEFWAEITKGYCLHCGYALPKETKVCDCISPKSNNELWRQAFDTFKLAADKTKVGGMRGSDFDRSVRIWTDFEKILEYLERHQD